MKRTARVSKSKIMNPNFFVFCEGETEEVYIKFLRSVYRVPIQIISRKSDSNISDKYIERCKKEYVETRNDKTFLMFDLDVNGMLERLQRIPNVVLLCTNPCIELWFILHYIDCKSALTSNECVKKLIKQERQYAKGTLTDFMKSKFLESVTEAIERAKKLPLYENPSSSVYCLVEELHRMRMQKSKLS